MVHRISFLLGFFLFFSNALMAAVEINRQTVIIFDIDGLVNKDAKKEFWEVGPSNFFGWYNPVRVKEDFFNHLDLVLPHRAGDPLIMRDGAVLPQLIHDWLTNRLPVDQIRKMALEGLEGLGKKTRISQAIAKHVFNPKSYVETIVVDRKGKELLRRCCDKRDASGKKANKVYILTNWNAESFELLCKNPEVKEMLSWVDGVMYSGKEHLAKPDPRYFDLAFQRFGIDPDLHHIIYFDIEITNIKAIQELYKRVNCIHCRNLNFRHVENELKRFNAL